MMTMKWVLLTFSPAMRVDGLHVFDLIVAPAAGVTTDFLDKRPRPTFIERENST
jgi:hypothetical protein